MKKSPRDRYVELGCPAMRRMIGVTDEERKAWTSYLRPWMATDGASDVSRESAECYAAGAVFYGTEEPPGDELPEFAPEYHGNW